MVLMQLLVCFDELSITHFVVYSYQAALEFAQLLVATTGFSLDIYISVTN